jgi:hypothetical protein
MPRAHEVSPVVLVVKADKAFIRPYRTHDEHLGGFEEYRYFSMA